MQRNSGTSISLCQVCICIKMSLSCNTVARRSCKEGYILYTLGWAHLLSNMFYGTYMVYIYTHTHTQIRHHIHKKSRHFPNNNNNNNIQILRGAPNISGNVSTVRRRRRSTWTNHSGITLAPTFIKWTICTLFREFILSFPLTYFLYPKLFFKF
jgi:hypothetical protein